MSWPFGVYSHEIPKGDIGLGIFILGGLIILACLAWWKRYKIDSDD